MRWKEMFPIEMFAYPVMKIMVATGSSRHPVVFL